MRNNELQPVKAKKPWFKVLAFEIVIALLLVIFFALKHGAS